MEDDFGDLYADVVDGLHIEPEQNSPTDGSKSTEADEKFIVDSVMQYSDSEDDLNIVLNDDECEKFPVTGARSHSGGFEENENGEFGVEGTTSDKISRRLKSDGSDLNPSGNGVERGSGTKIEFRSHLKYARLHGSSFASNIRVNGLTGMSSFSSMSRSGDREDDVYDQKMVASMKPLPHQFGYGFSLPWYRTILDVNIDAFEEKPWRHPCADIIDFFNFGFNEDSWKEYCTSLEKFQQQSSKQAMIPSHYSSKFDQAYEGEAGHERVTRGAMTEDVAKIDSSLKFADRGEMLLQLPKGRAIQVEDSINERQPSMEIRRLRFQDSDVIIQIPVQDSTVDSSKSAKEELGPASKSDVSESGKMDQVDRDACFSVSASSVELKGEHYARVINVSTSSLGRSLSASNRTSLEPGGHRKENVSDMNEKCHSNMEVCILGGTAEAIERKNKGNEVAFRNTHRPDTYITETKLSHDNRSHFSPTFSFSENNSEERTEDSVHTAYVETQSPSRRKSIGSGTGLQKSVDHKGTRSGSHKIKSDDGEDFSVRKIPLRDKQKNGSWRHRHHVKERILVEGDDEYDTYRSSDGEGVWKRCRRHGNPIEEKWKHHHGRPNGIINQKIYPKNCYEASHSSNARELCYKYQSSVYHGKRKERSEDLFYHDKESSSYYWDKKLYVNSSKRFTDSHLSAFDGKAYFRFRKESDQFARKIWNEEFYHERKGYKAKEDDMDGFLYHGRRRPGQKSLVPHTYGESETESFVSRYSSASAERNIQWKRRNNRLKFRKKTDHGDCPLDCKHEDEWLKQKYGTSISFTHSERGMVEPYERRRPPIRRDAQVSGRKGRYVDGAYFHLGRSGPTESEDEYQRHTHSRYLALETDRELSAHNRWFNTVSSRNEEYHSNLIERCHRHQRLVYHEEDLDGSWFSSYNYTDDHDLQNDKQVQSQGEGRSKQSRVLHWREDKLLVNDKLFNQGVSFSYEKSSKHDLIHARHGSLRDEMFLNDSMLEHHGYEMISERNPATCLKRSFISYRGEHEQEFPKDRDPADLIVGEGKPSVRHSDSRSKVCNGRLKKMGSEHPNKQKSVMEFDDSYGSKEVNMNIPNTDGIRNNEKQFSKFSVAECNKDLDIEEGQIINEEQISEDTDLEKENASETMMQSNKITVKTLLVDDASEKNGAVVECENRRILETLAKMEKRRERFKDPITVKREPNKTSAPQVDQTDETKRRRPARRRQWGVS
ncbi:putative Kinase superfamily protein [Hibiscus syriacus]|uniref:Kinase superfamily protein n=1 Tax=Hibiscus syriacus TaxID=106335 RepID=A0A6A3CDR6_HIBSY|nr:FIP1[V]-like protein [Hibiscus syriacus]KAE8725851.1 putative Kinase superfamily protein [Hibiscus syriacus]